MINNCQTMEDFEELVASSREKPVFLFKHSTNCPISRSRWGVFQGFAEQEPRAEFWMVLVIQDRSVSLHIARKTGVMHQSPQAILFREGEAVWDTSHYSITEEAMTRALEAVSS